MRNKANLPLDRLKRAGEHLGQDLRRRILALGPSAIPPLIAILRANEGWAAVHAVELLVDLGATDAILPMLEMLELTEFDELVHDRIGQHLPRLGAPVLEPAIAKYEALDDPDARDSIGWVLSDLGVRDPRVFEILCDAFNEEPVLGAMQFGSY